VEKETLLVETVNGALAACEKLALGTVVSVSANALA